MTVGLSVNAKCVLLSGSVTGIGDVSGVGAATPKEPRYNYTLDPYFTDGLRAVLFLGKDTASPDDVEFVPWKRPDAVETRNAL
jgi:hypothetical protein